MWDGSEPPRHDNVGTGVSPVQAEPSFSFVWSRATCPREFPRRSRYNQPPITLTIVVLVAHTRPPWVVAYHRFVEVSLGIAVALMVTKIWHLPAPK